MEDKDLNNSLDSALARLRSYDINAWEEFVCSNGISGNSPAAVLYDEASQLHQENIRYLEQFIGEIIKGCLMNSITYKKSVGSSNISVRARLDTSSEKQIPFTLIENLDQEQKEYARYRIKEDLVDNIFHHLFNNIKPLILDAVATNSFDIFIKPR